MGSRKIKLKTNFSLLERNKNDNIYKRIFENRKKCLNIDSKILE